MSICFWGPLQYAISVHLHDQRIKKGLFLRNGCKSQESQAGVKEIPVFKEKGLFYTFSLQVKSCIGVTSRQNPL